MPIATLTLNPAIDVTYDIDRLLPDRKVHAAATRYDPGGNGINVSRALKRLQVPARTFCVLAGETGLFLERLLQRHLDDPAYIRIAGETRINCTLLEQASGSQYEVSGIGPHLGTERLDDLLDTFVGYVAEGYGVVTGSVPPGVGPDVYAQLVGRIRAQGGWPVLDAHGELLRLGVQARPFLVKPNRYELEQLVGRPLPDADAVAGVLPQLEEYGIDYWCVSLGGEGAVLFDGHRLWRARPPRVPVRSTVGAGDSMVAALVAGFAREMEAAEILRLAVACSAGTVMQPGTELFDPERLLELLQQVEVTIIDRRI
ncbi:6-phosphofructokinase 2 [Methylomarinovum caldicuralii]|uniref:Phosphofructokinase n=1 Tax=Methylomarinovum caldicuralii TaxID=438856 RepID=A0AAU9CQK0_9GAMM|nr:1-phosphofructokinase family hexose kinase [Methylomarinovum caldicuralii]BCX81777.1 6-phosphofructokinase 2 [Methylomarinovum caldicuralii]